MTSYASRAASFTRYDPPVHRGLEKVDRTLFKRNIPLLAVRIQASDTPLFLKQAGKPFILRLPRVTAITTDPDSAVHRLVLLGPEHTRNQLPPALIELISDRQFSLVDTSVDLDYDYWSADQILQATLPEELLADSPSAFTAVGHIAHLNLRDEYLPHRHLIGQVILDKNKGLRTVVNKLKTIDNTFRNFQMEVLAGDDDFNVTLIESNCIFKFDFSAVYWNSRLQGEHDRLVQSFAQEDVVVDAFAGVGPFAVPAGKKGCGVLASDLNPASASALSEAVRVNKVEDTVRTANKDARDFIRKSVTDVWTTPFAAYESRLSGKVKEQLARRQRDALKLAQSSLVPGGEPTALPSAPIAVPTGPPRALINHFVMNLPASAIEFLDAYRGLYLPLLELKGAREAIEAAGGENGLPMVHCYCFTKEIEVPQPDILARASKALGLTLTADAKDFNLRWVRSVAPNKDMYCLEFRLSWEMVTTM